MNLHLKQGYYKDIRACEEIAKDSVLYERYFANDYRTEDYVRAYFPDDGKGRLYFSDFNVKAFEFYKANGYYEVGIIPNALTDGIGEHLMLKDLC